MLHNRGKSRHQKRGARGWHRICRKDKNADRGSFDSPNKRSSPSAPKQGRDGGGRAFEDAAGKCRTLTSS